MLRKIFLARINSKLTECRTLNNIVDLYNHFSKFDKIATLSIKRDGGYGFLLFKSRKGPVGVFEAGEIHSIKGFKQRRTVHSAAIYHRSVFKGMRPVQLSSGLCNVSRDINFATSA